MAQANIGTQSVISRAFPSTPTWAGPQSSEGESSTSTFQPLEHRALHTDTNNGTISLIEDQEPLQPVHSSDRGFPTYATKDFAIASKPKHMSKPPVRNLPVVQPFRTLVSYKHNGILLHPGVCVELEDKTFVRIHGAAEDENEPHNVFIRIIDIIQDTRSQAVTLRGGLFQRASYLHGVLKKDRNEVCWIMHVDDDDTRDYKVQAMETVPVEDVLRRRRLILTNRPFPMLSFREDESCLLEPKDTIRNERVLVCRFKYICIYTSADRRDANAWSERVLQSLRAIDCDKMSAADDKELRKTWRGETVPGGAHLPFQPTKDMNVIDLTEEATEPAPEVSVISAKRVQSHRSQPQVTEIATRVDWTTNEGLHGYTINGIKPAKRTYGTDDMRSTPSKRHQNSQSSFGYKRPPPTGSLLDKMRRDCAAYKTEPPTKRCSSTPKPNRNRQYTFNDYFCGAGGMSRAAYDNKLHIQDAFDFDKNACHSYGLNFPNARIHCLWAHEFVNLPHDCKVDIAHLSPPCKFFSDAHTKAGKDDEMNTASWTALGELLMKSKPRVVTLEQTYGILRARHEGYLNALIQVFSSHGFSIRWRLLNCADYGLPQMRLRLFMIASCPGEPLPPFPPPTHSSSPAMTGLLSWTTISTALASIPSNASHHDPHLSTVRAVPPRSGNRLARTITCGGGGQVHTSGTRDYTNREFATLNGFGPEHEFGSKGAKKQIGNAVPPIVGGKVLGSVVDALKKEDGISGE
ncbi:hypothetical protein XANCAGTX0491_002545 [Xanthoria calcicola]